MYNSWGSCQPSPALCYEAQNWSALSNPAFLVFFWCKAEATAVEGAGYALTSLADWHSDPLASPATFADGHVTRIRFFGYLSDYRFPANAGAIASGCSCP